MEGSTTPPWKNPGLRFGNCAFPRRSVCSCLSRPTRSQIVDLLRELSHRDLRQRYRGLPWVKRRENVPGTARHRV